MHIGRVWLLVLPWVGFALAACGAVGGGLEDAAVGADAPTTVDARPTMPDAMGSCGGDGDCTALDGNCQVGRCLMGMCQAEAQPDLTLCNDGMFCTVMDRCMGGVCGGAVRPCVGGSDACHVRQCDEATDGCVDVPGNDGAVCDDGDACTNDGSCSTGACVGAPGIDCSFLDSACTVGVCMPGAGCVAVPTNEDGGCDDSQTCTQNEYCTMGVCGGGDPVVCGPAGGSCVTSYCAEFAGGCITDVAPDGSTCDDTNACTAGETCTGGACGGGLGISGGACNDGNGCTILDTCMGGTCIGGGIAPNGTMCNDGASCTAPDTCTAGMCGGPGPITYFSDDFHDNSKGWVFDPEWQIGPAMESFGGAFGADPANDHSLTPDDGVAGVVIGGNAGTALHAYYYLTSAPFNSTGPGPVILGFYRWLNSDYDPFMHNTIDVWNGAAWVNVWTTGPAPGIADTAWTYIEHDLTAHKNAAMRIRFGFDISSGGVFTIGSWNIDDVRVAATGCP